MAQEDIEYFEFPEPLYAYTTSGKLMQAIGIGTFDLFAATPSLEHVVFPESFTYIPENCIDDGNIKYLEVRNADVYSQELSDAIFARPGNDTLVWIKWGNNTIYRACINCGSPTALCPHGYCPDCYCEEGQCEVCASCNARVPYPRVNQCEQCNGCWQCCTCEVSTIYFYVDNEDYGISFGYYVYKNQTFRDFIENGHPMYTDEMNLTIQNGRVVDKDTGHTLCYYGDGGAVNPDELIIEAIYTSYAAGYNYCFFV